jgi:pyruvate dehydrogenase E1 component alpha subunit
VQPLDLFKYVFDKQTPQLKEQSELLASELARAESADNHGTESAK